MKKAIIISVSAIAVVLILLVFVFRIFETELPKNDDSSSNNTPISDISKLADPNEAIFKVDGEEVTWKEYCAWLDYAKIAYESAVGEITDWTKGTEQDESVPIYRDFKDYTLSIIKLHKAIELRASEMDITLSDGDKAEIQTAFDEMKEDYSEEFDEYLKANYGGEELYTYFQEVGRLYSECFAAVYGESGEKLSDADVAEYVSEDGYMAAKHILFLTIDESGIEISEEEKAEKRASAEKVLADINSYDGDDKEGYFTSLMNEYSEDTGLEAMPDGYLFQSGDMMDAFDEAVSSMDEYEISGIVETAYGYHIIMRLPLNFDLVPISYGAYGSTYSLRHIVADDMFYAALTALGESLSVETTKFYDDFQVTSYFVS